jgi:hypothetical protein
MARRISRRTLRWSARVGAALLSLLIAATDGTAPRRPTTAARRRRRGSPSATDPNRSRSSTWWSPMPAPSLAPGRSSFTCTRAAGLLVRAAASSGNPRPSRTRLRGRHPRLPARQYRPERQPRQLLPGRDLGRQARDPLPQDQRRDLEPGCPPGRAHGRVGRRLPRRVRRGDPRCLRATRPSRGQQPAARLLGTRRGRPGRPYRPRHLPAHRPPVGRAAHRVVPGLPHSQRCPPVPTTS